MIRISKRLYDRLIKTNKGIVKRTKNSYYILGDRKILEHNKKKRDKYIRQKYF